MKKFVYLVFLIGFSIAVIGCKSLGIVQISPDTYMASKTSAGGIFVSMASLKAEVITAANQFATNQGKVAIPISIREIPAIPLRNPSVEYQFRVVASNDPEAKRTALTPRADVTIERTDRISMDIRKRDAKPTDLYTELTKLNDLKKSGIITQDEFETQKKRLLEK